jgi:hypothetical protein
MTNRQFLLLHTLVYGFFAAALFFMPGLLWPLYGVEINDQYAQFLSQHNSIFLGGIAAISYSLRDIAEKSPAAIGLIKGLIISNGLGLLITLYACLGGVFSGFGWSDPAFFGLLSAISYGQLKKNR